MEEAGKPEAAASTPHRPADGLGAYGALGRDLERDLQAKASGENFPVASRLLPWDIREDLLRVYRFARLVDDIGDETIHETIDASLGECDESMEKKNDESMGKYMDKYIDKAGVEAGVRNGVGHGGAGEAVTTPVSPVTPVTPATGSRPAVAERCRLLDAIEADLERMYAGAARIGVLRDLEPTVRRHRIPAAEFRALIEANRRDQRVCRYQSFPDLLDYCALSANPVGHIVLYVFDAATPLRLDLADRICTGLQLLEHCQDVAEDYRRGRIYLPLDDLERFGCREQDLVAPATAHSRRLLAFQTDRARRILNEGAPLVGTLRGFARVAVAGYVAGGRAAAAAIRAAGYDVVGGTPRPAAPRVVGEWLRAIARGR